MADWSIWKALEDWRGRRHELAPVFARAGVAPDVESAINMVCVNLKRHPPTPPLVTGDKTRDEESVGMYHAGFYRHFDESFYRAESLLQLSWVPEVAPLGERIRAEIVRLRQALREHPGKNPGTDGLEKLLRQYGNLDFPDMPQLAGILSERRRQLIDVAGYPLLVQHALTDPCNDDIPPLTSAEFRLELMARMRAYKETEWLHNRVITNAYVTLALEMALAHKRLDVIDDARVARLLKNRWPSLSVLLPEFDQADQVWYLLLTILTLCLIFMEMWVLVVPLILWLNLSLGAHRREKREIEARRGQLLARMKSMKRTKDRFTSGSISLEKLAFQLRQLDENDEYFDDTVYELTGLHQHEA
ncbi:hypothetical protein SAMN05660284_00568 [Formivibrio citricus]|uniref:Uncharacterized protein n=1 Tax=Formivibrio citricus TaxID=83765 RepID=A0A1I4WFC7_9NEIS|nr:hypothetical protein [Formivibrio citricus]SFN11886.1 hypothetical protein SAMN05660284_00568 [Formivibrio citricus]